jgi:hypothetical protein
MSITDTSSSNYSSTGIRKFFPHPNQLTISTGIGNNRRLESIPIINQPSIPIQYQDVGDNPNLQSDVTDFFYTKVLKWINKDIDFKHLKKHYSFFKNHSGKKYIYNMLRLFVKKSKANWYDLREQNYDIVKKYLKSKIGNI